LEFSDENDLNDIKLNDITRNNQYEYNNFEISQKSNIIFQKHTQTITQNTVAQQIQTEQIEKSTYKYCKSSIKLKKDKKHNQDSKDDKKTDDNKNSGNEKSNYEKASYFASGAGVTILIGFELFLMWSTYFYWTQQRGILKMIEKVKKDIDSLLKKIFHYYHLYVKTN
jgi:ATP-dependent Zn protease